MNMNLMGAIEILKLHKHTTDKFKHSIGDKYVSEAIDTVVTELEKPLPTDAEIADYVFDNFLEDDSVMEYLETRGWVAGARWMRNLIQERSKK